MSASTNVRDFAKLPGLDPALELVPDLGIGGFSHAAHQCCFKDRATVLHSRSLEDMIARPCHGLLRLNVCLRHLVLPMLARLGDDAVRLMPVLCGQLAVPLQDFSRRQQFLAVARMVGRDLCRRGSVDPLFPEMVFDLFTSRAGSLQIFLRVAFYLRLSVLAALQFVAKLFQTQSQLGSVEGGDVAL